MVLHQYIPIGELNFSSAKDKGIPIKIKGFVDAHLDNENFVGYFCEPDFENLSAKMKEVYQNYKEFKKKSTEESKVIREEFNWERVGLKGSEILDKDFVYVTGGNINYMPTIEKLVQSLNEFSKHKVIVYGVYCDVPFNYPNMIKKRIIFCQGIQKNMTDGIGNNISV